MIRTSCLSDSTVVIMSNNVISDSQFAASVNAGGASRRIDNAQEGPKGGFYVANPKHETPLTSPATAQKVAEHRGQVSQTASHGYQGGWYDKSDGQGFLDHSVRVNSPALAHSLGTIWNQRAAYNANTGKDLRMSDPSPSAAVKR